MMGSRPRSELGRGGRGGECEEAAFENFHIIMKQKALSSESSQFLGHSCRLIVIIEGH